MIQKFYVGAKHIGAAIGRGQNVSCTHSTYTEAVEQAKQMLRDEGLDCVVVVEIVAIVRKDFPPITVERI